MIIRPLIVIFGLFLLFAITMEFLETSVMLIAVSGFFVVYGGNTADS